MPMPLGQGFRGQDGRVGYLLRQAQHALSAAMYQPLADLGITAAQYSVLSVARTPNRGCRGPSWPATPC